MYLNMNVDTNLIDFTNPDGITPKEFETVYFYIDRGNDIVSNTLADIAQEYAEQTIGLTPLYYRNGYKLWKQSKDGSKHSCFADYNMCGNGDEADAQHHLNQINVYQLIYNSSPMLFKYEYQVELYKELYNNYDSDEIDFPTVIGAIFDGEIISRAEFELYIESRWELEES